MIKKILSVAIAAILLCATLCGCVNLDFLNPTPPKKPSEVQKVKITIDSNPAPTLNAGETYKLIYSCVEEVTITADGKFNLVTNVFTADKAGEFKITLTAGSGESATTQTVTITVIAKGDGTKLKGLIASAKNYLAEDYYDYSALTEELKFASSIANKQNATQSELDGAYTALQAVIASLKPIAFGNKKAVIASTQITFNGETYQKVYYSNFDVIASGITAINADGDIKLYSQYTAKVNAELKKLTKINGKELAKMNIQRGTAMAKKVYDSYYVNRLGILGGNVVYDVLNDNGEHIKNEGTGNKETDFWTMTSLFALMVRLDEVSGESNRDKVDKIIDAMSYYRGTRTDNKVGANGSPRAFSVYGVHRANIPNGMDVVGYLGRESVFDDQIWAAQEFLNAYNLYKDNKYLDIATELTEYIYLVGNCPELGGIYWGQGYTTRHACSSAPFVKLAVMLADATKQTKYLDWAKSVYKFCYDKLRDASDDLYYDLIATRYIKPAPNPEGPDWINPKDIEGNKAIGDGAVDKKKYSYNSGSMVSAGVALYKATGERHYLDEAQKTASSSRKYFGKLDEKTGLTIYPGSDGGVTYSWFDLILFKGYFDLYAVDKSAAVYLDEVQNTYDYNYQKYMKGDFMPTSGLSGWTTGRNSYGYRVLMDHVTNADVMLLLGQYKNLT